MSLESLRRTIQSHLDEEEAIDRAAAKRHEARKRPTENLQEATDELYGKVLREVQLAVDHSALGEWTYHRTEDFIPTDVANEVIRRFEKRGWRAEHKFNDGMPMYDGIAVALPDDWVSRLLGEEQ